jgi:nucleoid-associated protein YgaU
MTDPNDHLEDPGTPEPAEAPSAEAPSAEAAASSEVSELPVWHPELPKGAVVATAPVVAAAPVVARPVPMLAGRRQFARTSPVVVDRGRASFGLPSFGDRRQLGQIGLVVLMVVALGAILLARLGQSDTPGLAGGSPTPHASVHASPKTTPRPSATATSSPGPSTSAPARTPGASPTTKPATYKVKSGDTLSSIAARFHTTAKAIEDLNGLKSPFVIHPGEVLKLP